MPKQQEQGQHRRAPCGNDAVHDVGGGRKSFRGGLRFAFHVPICSDIHSVKIGSSAHSVLPDQRVNHLPQDCNLFLVEREQVVHDILDFMQAGRMAVFLSCYEVFD